jgi:predicted SnoaL-like aldol condensation-catalyzing enzyme
MTLLNQRLKRPNTMSTSTQSEAGGIAEIAADFLRSVVAGRVAEAYRQYIGHGFRHHNPYFQGDAESLQRAMQEDARAFPDKSLEIQHSVRQGNLVVIHSRVQMAPGGDTYGLVHIFRFKGQKIIELWDIAQMVPKDSPNENGAF